MAQWSDFWRRSEALDLAVDAVARGADPVRATAEAGFADVLPDYPSVVRLAQVRWWRRVIASAEAELGDDLAWRPSEERVGALRRAWERQASSDPGCLALVRDAVVDPQLAEEARHFAAMAAVFVGVVEDSRDHRSVTDLLATVSGETLPLSGAA